MKIKKSEIKTCKTAYLYHDGHLVLVHKKRDKDAGEINWVTMYQSIGIKTYFSKPGRLIIDQEVLPFLTVCSRIDVKTADVKRGSDNTRKLNLPVESISLYNGVPEYGWHISNFPGLISSQIYYNDNDTTEFDADKEYYSWCHYPVKRVYLDS